MGINNVKLSSAVIKIVEKLPNGSIIESQIGIEFAVKAYRINENKTITFVLPTGHKLSSPITHYYVENISDKKKKK